VKVDTEFLKRAATLLGNGTQPNHISDILSALDDAGLLLATGAGVRVSPDLLSDHLAYTACYDKHGRDTTFVERVVTQFPPDQFPKLMQHLAEAEWRALRENESADSVVEPLWRSLVTHFETSSFYVRAEQLKAWANIAHLQPRRTLELAQLALRLDTAPPDEYPLLRLEKWNSHTHVLDGLPTLLKPLAEHHPEYVGPSLDILWKIGRDHPAPPFNSQGHPIAKIGEISSFQLGKNLAIQDEVLNWAERLLAGDDWINRGNDAGWLLGQVLNPFFATGMEEHWRTGNTIHWRTVPLHLDNTAKYRDRVFTLLRCIVKRRSVALTLATLGVIEHAMHRAYFGASTVPPKFKERWLIERKKALAVLAEIVRDCGSPIIHFRARRILLANMRYEEAGFRAACREVFETIPDSLDVQLVRATVGGYWDEFEGSRSEDWQNHAKRRWGQFIRSTAEATLSQWPQPDVLLTNLAQRHNELVELGFHPNFWPLLRSIAEARPKLALEIADGLIEQRSHPLGPLLNALVMPITAANTELRLKLCENAIAGGSDELRVGAIGCFTSWRQEGNLPNPAWKLLAQSAPTASSFVANAIIRFVWLNDSAANQSDWELLGALPVDPKNFGIAHQLMGRAGHLLEKKCLPTPEVADQILRKLDGIKSLGGHEIEHGLSEFAKHFAGKVFLLLWRRHQCCKGDDAEFEVVPFDFDAMRFADVISDPDAAAVIHQLEERLINGTDMDYQETRILQIAVMQSGDNPEVHLLRLVELAESAEQLNRVATFAADWQSWPIVLSCPDFTRSLLQKVTATDEKIHKEIFRRLQGLPGSRGSSAYEPNDKWKSLVEAVEKMAEQYMQDPELGPLYAAAAKNERAWIELMRKRFPDDEDLLDE
jgi:hypothetical protein